MKQRRLLIMMFLLVLHQLAFAAPRTFRQAQAIAERQAAKLGIVIDQKAMTKSRTRYATTSIAPISTTQAPYYLFANGEGKGFTIVSGDDRLPEIVGYSDRGTLDESQMPEGLKAYLEAYKQKVEAIVKGDQEALRANAEQQALLSDGNYKQPTVEPLLGNIAWSQDAPYNNYCPEYGPGKRCVVGCVATATAQILMYHKYPKQLMADIEPYHSTQGKYEFDMPGVSKGETYDWDNMLDTYAKGKYTEEQAAATAKLSYHCGLALNMQYGQMSDATPSPEVFAKYFGYDADLMQTLIRGCYSLSEWMRIIDRELESARPILYVGFSMGGGHAFVCDGSNGTGFYHINWGWNGYGNGYFDITTLDPEYRGIGSGTTLDGYSNACFMIIGITPDNGKKDEPMYKTPSLTVSSYGDHSCEILQGKRDNESQTFKIYINSNYSNYQASTFEGDIAIGIKKEDGTYEPINNNIKTDTIGSLMTTKREMYALTDTIDYVFPVGTTVVYNIYRQKGGEWQPMGYFQEYHPFELTATETSLSYIPYNLSGTIKAGADLEALQKDPYTATITNNGNYEYHEALYVRTAPTPTMPTDTASIIRVQIPIGESITRNLGIPSTKGDQYIWISDASGKVIVNGQKFTVKPPTIPHLVLTGKSLNWTPGIFEEEKGYLSGYRIKLPVIKGNKATATYTVRNDGTPYKGPIGFYTVGCSNAGTQDTTSVTKLLDDVVFDGDGATTTITYDVTLEELKGNKSIYIVMISPSQEIDMSSKDLYQYAEMFDLGYTWAFTQSTVAGYLAGSDPTAIQPVIATSATGCVNVYSLDSQLVKRIAVKDGKLSLQSLPKGIYIIEGKKVVVK